MTADGILTRHISYHTEQGPVTETRSRHVWLNKEDHAPETVDETLDPGIDHLIENQGVQDANENADTAHNTRTTKSQQYYLQEFVDCVNPLLAALLSRETPEQETCARCAAAGADTKTARWRCKDCSSASVLCRKCMRQSHMDNPFHRIEVWNGTYFQAAALWQVGVYVLIPHHSETRLCPTLKWNQALLDGFQSNHDDREQHELREANNCHKSGILPPVPTDLPMYEHDDVEMEGNNTVAYNDLEGDALFADHLDRLYNKGLGADIDVSDTEHILEEDNIEFEADKNPLPMPKDYMPSHPNVSLSDATNAQTNPLPGFTTDLPRTDALDNPFLRVVHVNGIHFISTVFCNCRGRENTHCDCMAACLVPTSFVRYRTMFTHSVLDDFRLSNLECKTSAYQYFQKLCRHTLPTSPESVPNLYHELRQMSRLWRWMKKLKWAGFGHTQKDHTNPQPGSMANFCPACPQPGINLPEDWYLDEQWHVTFNVCSSNF